jgi:hypothetical protein
MPDAQPTAVEDINLAGDGEASISGDPARRR